MAMIIVVQISLHKSFHLPLFLIPVETSLLFIVAILGNVTVDAEYGTFVPVCNAEFHKCLITFYPQKLSVQMLPNTYHLSVQLEYIFVYIFKCIHISKLELQILHVQIKFKCKSNNINY